MTYGVFNSVAFQVSSGVMVAPGASVAVMTEAGAPALATIFDDANGAVKANPFLADAQGRFAFYAAGIALGYKVTVTQNGNSVVLRNVPIGTAMYHDLTAIAAGLALTKNDVGLGNVDNTSDANKPVSALQAAAIAAAAPVSNALWNGRFNARVSANTLIFEILTNAGVAPSAGDPVYIAFRDPTLTSGAFIVRTLTAALSITIPDTALLGTLAGIPARLYGILADEAGAVRIGVYNPLSGTSLVGLSESNLISSTLVSAAADLAQTIYTNDAVAACAFRLVGFCEIQEAVAGTWATAPTKVHTLKTGDRRTGDTIQEVRTATGASATTTVILPGDDTIPQITEGAEFMTATLTPSSPINVLEAMSPNVWSLSTTAHIGVALFRDAVADAIAGQFSFQASANQIVTAFVAGRVIAGATSPTVFRLRAGCNVAGTATFNGGSGARLFGGVMGSFLNVREIFV